MVLLIKKLASESGTRAVREAGIFSVARRNQRKTLASLFVVLMAFLFLICLLSLVGAPLGGAEASSMRAFSWYGRVQNGPSPAIPPRGGNQQNNQSFQGVSNSGNRALLMGRNQGNSGNQGVNRGFNQDNSVSSGNQISGQRRPIGYQQNNQSISGNGGSNSGNSLTNIGFDQGNSGNQGVNVGNNQDNAGNSGNQVNNQANVIGTQVNNQGSTVNNNGNIIGRQINYINLLPSLGIYLGLKPKPEFVLSLGK